MMTSATTRKRTTTRPRTISTTTAELLPPAPLFFGLGANLGDRERTLQEALAALDRRFGPLEVAGLYRSAPVVRSAARSENPALAEQPDFFNTAAAGYLRAPTPARALLAELKQLERAAGRDPSGARDGPRPLDIDLLAVGHLVLDLGDDTRAPEGHWPGPLTLPHPRLRERRFVLRPLADLEPDLVLPGERRTVQEQLAALGESQHVEQISWRERPIF